MLAFDATHVLAYSVALAWLMILTAALLRVRGNLVVAFSNRHTVPAETPLSGRAERAARNMLENLLLFVAAWAATRSAGVLDSRVTIGAQLFFFARLAYWPVYLAGIPYLRTLLWLAGVAGVAVMLSAALT